MILRPYVTWLQQMQDTNDAVGRLYAPLLARAKRFVMPEGFSVFDYLGERYEVGDGAQMSDALDPVIRNNWRLPFDVMYLQVPVSAIMREKQERESLLPWFGYLLIQNQETNQLAITTANLSMKTSRWSPDMVMWEWSGDEAEVPEMRMVRQPDQTDEEWRQQRILNEVTTIYAFTALDVINFAPVDVVERQGRRLLRNNIKKAHRDRIEHRVVKLGAPYYKYLDALEEERTRIRHRHHDVRGHWRTLANGRQTWVKSHSRGDASLGRVETEYDLPLMENG